MSARATKFTCWGIDSTDLISHAPSAAGVTVEGSAGTLILTSGAALWWRMCTAAEQATDQVALPQSYYHMLACAPPQRYYHMLSWAPSQSYHHIHNIKCTNLKYGSVNSSDLLNIKLDQGQDLSAVSAISHFFAVSALNRTF